MKSIWSDIGLYYLSLGNIEGLYRFPVKGFSGESLNSVTIGPSETFQDDRRFAHMKDTTITTSSTTTAAAAAAESNDNNNNNNKFDPENPIWLHKENFLCSFSDPVLLSQYTVSFDSDSQILNLHDRVTKEQLLGPIDFSTVTGRQKFANYFSNQINIPLNCVTAATAKNHQFGNTSSSWKKNRDTRTIHIINRATVRELSDSIGIDLNPTRFRPNIIIDGPDPWSEWDWIDKCIQFGSSSSSSAQLEVISKTVRCDGVSVDPLEYPNNVLDIPSLMMKHFPEQGPYLGVYAIVKKGGTITLGDDIKLL